MKSFTVNQLFDKWFAHHYIVTHPSWMEPGGIEKKATLKWAWLAGRREGMRYPGGRRQDSYREYLRRGNL
jgi:hypothetical protein